LEYSNIKFKTAMTEIGVDPQGSRNDRIITEEMLILGLKKLGQNSSKMKICEPPLHLYV